MTEKLVTEDERAQLVGFYHRLLFWVLRYQGSAQDLEMTKSVMTCYHEVLPLLTRLGLEPEMLFEMHFPEEERVQTFYKLAQALRFSEDDQTRSLTPVVFASLLQDCAKRVKYAELSPYRFTARWIEKQVGKDIADVEMTTEVQGNPLLAAYEENYNVLRDVIKTAGKDMPKFAGVLDKAGVYETVCGLAAIVSFQQQGAPLEQKAFFEEWLRAHVPLLQVDVSAPLTEGLNQVAAVLQTTLPPGDRQGGHGIMAIDRALRDAIAEQAQQQTPHLSHAARLASESTATSIEQQRTT